METSILSSSLISATESVERVTYLDNWSPGWFGDSRTIPESAYKVFTNERVLERFEVDREKFKELSNAMRRMGNGLGGICNKALLTYLCVWPTNILLCPCHAFCGRGMTLIDNGTQSLELTTNGIALTQANHLTYTITSTILPTRAEGLTWTNIDPNIKVHEIEKVYSKQCQWGEAGVTFDQFGRMEPVPAYGVGFGLCYPLCTYVCDSEDISTNNYYITIKSISKHKVTDVGGAAGQRRSVIVPDAIIVIPTLTSGKASEVVQCILKYRSGIPQQALVQSNDEQGCQ